MKAAPLGGTILIKSTIDKVGGRIAFLNVDIYDKKTGDMIAKGQHTKFIG
jgi:predicted thioesterase